MKKLLYALLLLTSGSLSAAIEEVWFSVYGAHCGQCVETITEKSKEVHGVTKIDLKNNVMHLTIDPNAEFKLESLLHAVQKNQIYKVKNLVVCADGMVERKGHYFYLDNGSKHEKIYLLKDPNERVETPDKKKKKNAFIRASAKTWNKTSQFFTKLVVGSDTFEKDILAHYKNETRVRIQCPVHQHLSDSFWVSRQPLKVFSSKPKTRFKKIKTDDSEND
jgi:copper chaperone CopZ